MVQGAVLGYVDTISTVLHARVIMVGWSLEVSSLYWENGVLNNRKLWGITGKSTVRAGCVKSCKAVVEVLHDNVYIAKCV